MWMVMVSGDLNGLAESVKVRGDSCERSSAGSLDYCLCRNTLESKSGPSRSRPAAVESYSYIRRNTYVLAVQPESYSYTRRNTYIIAVHH